MLVATPHASTSEYTCRRHHSRISVGGKGPQLQAFHRKSRTFCRALPVVWHREMCAGVWLTFV